MEIDFTGISKGNIMIKVKNRVLTIYARNYRKLNVDDLPEAKLQTYDFERSFIMPGNANTNGISKRMKNGILKVYVKKIRY